VTLHHIIHHEDHEGFKDSILFNSKIISFFKFFMRFMVSYFSGLPTLKLYSRLLGNDEEEKMKIEKIGGRLKEKIKLHIKYKWCL